MPQGARCRCSDGKSPHRRRCGLRDVKIGNCVNGGANPGGVDLRPSFRLIDAASGQPATTAIVHCSGSDRSRTFRRSVSLAGVAQVEKQRPEATPRHQRGDCPVAQAEPDGTTGVGEQHKSARIGCNPKILGQTHGQTATVIDARLEWFRRLFEAGIAVCPADRSDGAQACQPR